VNDGKGNKSLEWNVPSAISWVLSQSICTCQSFSHRPEQEPIFKEDKLDTDAFKRLQPIKANTSKEVQPQKINHSIFSKLEE